MPWWVHIRYKKKAALKYAAFFVYTLPDQDTLVGSEIQLAVRDAEHAIPLVGKTHIAVYSQLGCRMSVFLESLHQLGSCIGLPRFGKGTVELTSQALALTTLGGCQRIYICIVTYLKNAQVGNVLCKGILSIAINTRHVFKLIEVVDHLLLFLLEYHLVLRIPPV